MLESHYQFVDGLVDRVKQGDSDALLELEHYYKPLINTAITKCCNREVALKNQREDLEREAFLVLNDLVEKYDPSAMTYFSYYLSTHLDYALQSRANKVLLSYTYASKGITEIPFSALPENWEPVINFDPFGQLWVEDLIQTALTKLNVKQREAIELYFFQNLTQEQSAEQLNINQASFSKLLKRALGKIKLFLPEDICI